MPDRTREDTVRQIVAGLTGDSDGTGDLAVELSKTDPASLETGQDSEDDSGEPEDWVPDPVDADPGQRLPALLPGSGFRGMVQSSRRSGLQFVATWALELQGIQGQSVTPPGSPGFFTWLGWCPRPDPWWGALPASPASAASAGEGVGFRHPHLVGLAGHGLPGTTCAASVSERRRWCLCRAGKSSSKRRSSDIISLLVSIYGSKDLFINEYRSLLADRLLHQFSFSPER